jgi:hypothetical protein
MAAREIPIWFFIGVLLSIYGLLIVGYGVFELVTGHTAQVALANLHAPVWWGGMMVVLGAFYCIRFAPGKD